MWSHTYPLAVLLWYWPKFDRSQDADMWTMHCKVNFEKMLFKLMMDLCMCMLFALSYGPSAGNHLINQNKTFIASKYCRCVSDILSLSLLHLQELLKQSLAIVEQFYLRFSKPLEWRNCEMPRSKLLRYKKMNSLSKRYREKFSSKV